MFTAKDKEFFKELHRQLGVLEKKKRRESAPAVYLPVEPIVGRWWTHPYRDDS